LAFEKNDVLKAAVVPSLDERPKRIDAAPQRNGEVAIPARSMQPAFADRARYLRSTADWQQGATAA
jgi:hypothetical protein